MGLPELRRRVLTLPQRDWDRYSYDKDGARLHAAPSTSVVPVPVPLDWHGEERLSRLSQSEGNEVFVRNPFDDDTYVVLDEAMSSFATAKYTALAKLCQLLGAKKLTAHELQVSDGTTKYKLALGGPTLPITAKGRFDMSLGEKVSRSLKAEWKFGDGETDIEAAERLLVEKRLDSDLMIKEMVSLRAEGRLERQTWTVNLTDEGSREVAFGAELKAFLPAVVLSKIGGELDFQRGKNTENRLEVTVDVEF